MNLLEEFESVKKLKEGLKLRALNRGKTLTESGWYHRIRMIKKYTNFTGLNPDKLIAEGVDAAMRRLTNYLMWMIGEEVNGIEPRDKSLSWNTACGRHACIRGFYSHNKIVFPKDFLSPRSKRSTISKEDSLTPLFDYNEETKESFMNDLLRKFVHNLHFRDRTIAICLLATGADAADLLALKVKFVRDARGHFTSMPRIPWHGNRLKDGIEFRTYFSKEATALLKIYIEQEHASADGEEYLFFNQYGKPHGVKALSYNFRTAAERMGYTKKGRMNPFRPKRFRHAFREACSVASVDQGYTEAMMGHSSSMSATYLEKGESSFLREYIKVEPYITLFSSTRKEATDLKETFSQEDKTEIDHLKQRIDKLKDDMIIQRLDKLEDDMKDTINQGLDKIADDVRKLMEIISIESNKTENEREEKWFFDVVSGKAEVVSRMNDGWQIIEKFKDGGFILGIQSSKCQNCKLQREEELEMLNKVIFDQLGELKNMEWILVSKSPVKIYCKYDTYALQYL